MTMLLPLKIQDLYSKETLSEKLDVILPLKNKTLEQVYGLKPYSKEKVLELCEKYLSIEDDTSIRYMAKYLSKNKN